MNQMAGFMYVVKVAVANSTKRKCVAYQDLCIFYWFIPQILTEVLQHGSHHGRHWQISQNISQNFFMNYLRTI